MKGDMFVLEMWKGQSKIGRYVNHMTELGTILNFIFHVLVDLCVPTFWYLPYLEVSIKVTGHCGHIFFIYFKDT